MDTVVANFRALHESGCFVLPNPWDAGSAAYLESLGFKALATTSAGYAFSAALPDGGIPRDRMLRHVREIVASTRLPVNADFVNGFADGPEEAAINAVLCVRTGAAGLSIEDANGHALYDRALAVERITAAHRAIEDTDTGVVLTARCEAFLVGDADPLRTSLDRLAAFAAAGADCLYAPGVKEPDHIAQLVKAVAPKPLNVLAVPGLSAKQLEDLGVRRISVGAALMRAAWAAFAKAAEEMLKQGSFESFSNATPFADLQDFFLKRKRPEA